MVFGESTCPKHQCFFKNICNQPQLIECFDLKTRKIDMADIEPLTKAEADAARAEASAGRPPSLEILRRFIATIRKSWLAKPAEKTQGKNRTKAAPVDENQIDFF